MDLVEFDRLALSYHGVRRRGTDGLLRWQCRGRLIARQLDDTHVVIRAPFDARDALVHQFPSTFSTPERFRKHMMVVADLAVGEADAIEDALLTAWRLQTAGA